MQRPTRHSLDLVHCSPVVLVPSHLCHMQRPTRHSLDLAHCSPVVLVPSHLFSAITSSSTAAATSSTAAIASITAAASQQISDVSINATVATITTKTFILLSSCFSTNVTNKMGLDDYVFAFQQLFLKALFLE